MKKTLGVLTVLLCATPMVYAQADGNAALKSSDVATALNGVAAKGKVIDSGSCGENVNYELYDDYTLRIFGKGVMYNYDLEYIDNGVHRYEDVYGEDVTTAPWGKNVKSVVIEDGVTRIGAYAFTGCTSLTDVNIPNSVTSIGRGSFQYCTALQKINIPNSVTSIGTYAFSECTSLSDVNIPESIVTLEENVFYRCISLEHIDIPNSITRIEGFAFEYCPFKEVIIPDNVTYIGPSAFAQCDNLKYVEIGKGVTVLNDAAFWCNCQTYRTMEVRINTETLITVLGAPNTFGNVEGLAIHVPKEILDDYRRSWDWLYYNKQFYGYGTTGISSVDNGQSAMKADVVYDLQGRWVKEMQPNGIYIVNGKKIVNK
ncbi:MAG: leucine-rich repeat domain-containing protein [Prevotella sp.]|nr:leucine-rich repeat domain-containing protein [Prevotella sp.]